jgi:hypothetical protein
MEAAEYFIEQRALYRRLIYEALKREQVSAQDCEMLFALGEIIVEKLCEKTIVGFLFRD